MTTSAAAPAPKPPAPVLRSLAAEVGGMAVSFPSFSDRPLDAASPDIRIALVVVHGIERNADTYLAFGAAAAAAAGDEVRAATLVVAPRFTSPAEARREGLGDDVPVWRNQAWKEGEDSAGARGGGAVGDGAVGDGAVGVSSFAALDALLAALADRTRFPALERVVLAGHSAGGQFVQHYAAASDGEDALTGAGVRVRYVVANPSSFVYMDAARPASDAARAGCPGYDDWKYGLRKLPPYVAAHGGADAVRARYERRDVVTLSGERDNDPRHPYLDRTCPAMLQGADRLDRALRFRDHLDRFYGHGVAAWHRFVIVPRVGHNARRMLKSSAARPYLFDEPSLFDEPGASSDSR